MIVYIFFFFYFLQKVRPASENHTPRGKQSDEYCFSACPFFRPLARPLERPRRPTRLTPFVLVLCVLMRAYRYRLVGNNFKKHNKPNKYSEIPKSCRYFF